MAWFWEMEMQTQINDRWFTCLSKTRDIQAWTSICPLHIQKTVMPGTAIPLSSANIKRPYKVIVNGKYDDYSALWLSRKIWYKFWSLPVIYWCAVMWLFSSCFSWTLRLSSFWWWRTLSHTTQKFTYKTKLGQAALPDNVPA